MANRSFNIRHALEKSVVDLFFKLKYSESAPTASLATTAPIELTKVATGTSINGYTLGTVVNAAAANPTESVLVGITGTAAATVVTVTPNDGTNNPTAQAVGTLDLTTDIVLTKAVGARPGEDGNGDTFELVVNAAAANPTNTVLVALSGTAAAIVCTVTPNDGTNNPTAQASGTLATTTPIVLTKVVGAQPGVLGNGDTFELVVNAAAANPTNTVLVDITGTADAIVCTVTPNDGTNNPTVQAYGSLATTTPIVLTKTLAAKAGVLGNGDTFELVVNAAAANPTNTVLVALSGTAAAIVCTVTPNDGTNNGATPVDLTTAELSELINNGTVVGKTVTLSGTTTLLDDQTATGGGANNLVDAGEGDGVVATFANGVNTAVNLTTANLVTLINSGAVGTVTLTDVGSLRNDQTATGGGANNLASGGEGDGEIATFANGVNTAVTITTANLVTLINSGAVGTVTLTDTGSLRNDQTATGGGAASLVNAGEGDGVIATFAGGVNSPVTLTTAELVELINSGTVAGKTVTLTDTGSLRNDQTATGGDATDLINNGEGDNLTATFSGAVDFIFNKKFGLKDAYLTAAGTIRAELEDRYYECLFLRGLIKDSTVRDVTFQLKADSVNDATTPYFDFHTVIAGSATTVDPNVEIWLNVTLKNTSSI